MKEQAITKELSLTDYRVRDWLIEDIGHNNMFVDIPQVQLAKELKVDRANVCRSIQRLVKLDILERDEILKKYRFNPAFLFSGSLDEGMKAKRQHKSKNRQAEAKPKWLN